MFLQTDFVKLTDSVYVLFAVDMKGSAKIA